MFCKSVREALLAGLLIIAGSGIVLDTFSSHQVAAADSEEINAAVLGKAYRAVLANTYADGWEAAAKALEEGKSVREAQLVLQNAWMAARSDAFRTHLKPS